MADQTKRKRRLRGWIIALGIIATITLICFIFRWVNTYTPKENWYGNGKVWASTDNFDDYYDAMPSITLKEGQTKIKVMQIADPQLKFGNFTQDTKTMDLLKLAIEKEQPDLAICSGDLTFTLFARSALNYFCKFMEEQNLYWGYVYGNHDSELSLSKYRISQILSNYKHCLFDGGPSNIKGESNYFIKVLDSSGNLLYVFSLLDSNMYPSNRTELVNTYYDEIDASQADWYSWNIEGLQTKKADIKSAMFMHMPLRAYVTLYNDSSLTNKAGGVYEDDWVLSTPDGDIEMPGIACQTGDNPSATSGGKEMYDAIVSKASTTAVFCGHDHINTFRGVDANGVLLAYGRCCGYHTYPFFQNKDDNPIMQKLLRIVYSSYEDQQYYLDSWVDETGKPIGKGVSFIEVTVSGTDYGHVRMYDRSHSSLQNDDGAIQYEINN